MERVISFEGTEEELLERNLCGCGTVKELIEQARVIVKDLHSDDTGCVIWNMCLTNMVSQLYVNRILLHTVREDGPLLGPIKLTALANALSEDVAKIMEIANEHIKKVVERLCDEDDVQDAVSESDGHVKH